MTKIKNWLHYWKNSLADAERAEIDFQRQKHFFGEHIDLSNGHLPCEDIKVLFDLEECKLNEQRGITKKDSPEWQSIEQIDLIIAPFVLQPLPEYQKYLRSTKPVFPFWIKATALPDGGLRVAEDHFPVIPRSVLAPSANENNDFIFSHVDTVDKATQLDKSEFEDWNDYWDFSQKVFKELTEQTLSSYKAEYYSRIDRTLYFVPDEKFTPSTHIIKLIENLLINESEPPLIKQIIETPSRKDNKPLAIDHYMDANSLHLGQMGCDYPLSITQRRALYTFLNAKDEKVFAVNGPPGTGKTTLLQSVVANYVVQSVKKDEPPVILACSTNNQAVINIIESFSKSNSNLPFLGQRWISSIEGFAAFLPSNSKQVLNGINYYKSDDSSNLSALDDYENVEKSEAEFLAHINEYTNKNFIDLTTCCDFLKDEIAAIENTLTDGKNLWKDFLLQIHSFNTEFNITTSSSKYYPTGQHDISITQLKKDKDSFTDTEGQVINYFNNEPFFRKIFCWLNIKSSLEKRTTEVRRLLRNTPYKFDESIFTNISKILNAIDLKIQAVDSTIHKATNWVVWKGLNQIKGNPPISEKELTLREASKTEKTKFAPCYLYDELDVSLRHKAFWLSIHFWEAKWILATKDFLNDDRKENKGAKGRMNMWRRRAMLTPCFVSTFFMAPRFFFYSKHAGKTDADDNLWESPPLEEFVDLLMVDESGQVTPEVGLPTFALCKKALVVGDVKQIEPVWNIIPKVDIGNLIKHDILKNANDPNYLFFKSKGLLASSGDVMSVAQRATNFIYDDPRVAERGMMLQEHRRCYNEIIKYCNEMAYSGVLKPLRGNSQKALLPPMVHFHVDSNSITKNKDRTNEKEAEVLLNWLVQYKEKIFDYYKHVKDYNNQFENMVGIITPFSGQKRTLIRLANSKGLNTKLMKIGTVHALQGAERPVILFSSVYGPGDTGTMFFDRDNKPNMLNVAVSRAKDSFIVFGNRNILDGKTTKPSGILAKHLKFYEN
ncbi:AAA domain-containing protein [Abyssalbus ytuae]|uniref:DEAD/DEAH box helicase n=1 Tax=Abyssalbus ytuae TaxID=2926907 RepID=A0A9E6ZZ65_9FLAO|nr:AAA domain-containing protein [Abyssalbus ytuae]UOB17872.1 DEAD/DEAH box helicase [Abyssalbus ytuae]